MTDGERIKLIRKALNLTQEAFGAPLGISKGHISDVEKDKKNLSKSAVELLKIRYAVNAAWWESGKGEMLDNKYKQFAAAREAEGRVKEAQVNFEQFRPRPVPVLGRISAGFPNIANDEIVGYIYPPDAPANSYSLVVSGDCMEPKIKDGDNVLFVTDGDYKLGDVLIVLDEWGEATMKRLREKEGVKYLVPDNPAFPTISPNEFFRIIGKVVKVWRDVKL